MKIEVNITRLDLLRVNLFLIPRIRYNWFFLIFLFLVGLGAGLLTLENFTVSSALIVIGVALVVMIPAFAITIFLLLCMNLAFASERTGLGWHKYEVEEEGLRETTNLNQDLSKWIGFERIWCAKRYIILQRSFAAFHMFPLRCFESQDAYREFFSAIDARLQRN